MANNTNNRTAGATPAQSNNTNEAIDALVSKALSNIALADGQRERGQMPQGMGSSKPNQGQTYTLTGETDVDGEGNSARTVFLCSDGSRLGLKYVIRVGRGSLPISGNTKEARTEDLIRKCPMQIRCIKTEEYEVKPRAGQNFEPYSDVRVEWGA